MDTAARSYCQTGSAGVAEDERGCVCSRHRNAGNAQRRCAGIGHGDGLRSA